MEYFIGAAVAFGAIFLVFFFLKKESNSSEAISVVYSQTHIFEILRPFISNKVVKNIPPSQSSKHYEEIFFKIFVLDDKAYWIKENTFYFADLKNGAIDQESTKPVDIMGMDKVQLNKMIFIIENLTEGNTNDTWDSK